MNRLSTTLCLLLAAPLTFAQTPGAAFNQAPEQNTVLRINNAADNLGCPVGFLASRQATGQTLAASESHHSAPALGLHLELDRRDTPAIESVEVTVYGLSPDSRVLPASQPLGDTISRTIELHRATGTDSLAQSDLWIHQFGVINWVDLTFITYADGTTWQATKHFKCRSVPSDLLLIGQR
jgi:hypothetical protein